MRLSARSRAFPRRAACAVAAGAIGAVMLVTLATSASAHAGLEASDPAAGELLASAPASVMMSFTEPPDPDLSSVTVIGASGAEIDTGALERGSAPRSLEVALPDGLGEGVYTVSWRVVSTADGHLTAGAFAFGVGATSDEVAAAPEAAPSTPSPSPLAVAGKVLLYAGLALAAGAAATGLVAFAGTGPARRLLLPLAGASAFVGAVAMTLAEADVVGASVGDLLSSAAGRSYVWLLGTTAVTLVASLVASRSPSRSPLAALGLAAAAAMLVRATSGHAAALAPSWPAELAQWVHFVAIGIWIGGLPPLLLLVRERRAAAAPAPVAEVARYSRMAGWSLLVVVLTGVTRTVGEAGGIGDVRAMVTDTSYGTTLIVKVALALLLIGLGAFNRRRSIPRLERDGTLLRQVVAIELVAALGVFGLTGVLTSLNPDPAAHMPAGPATPSVSASGADFATTTRVTFTATPGTAGPNTFEARIVDYDEGTPVEADEVTVLMAAIGRPEIEPATLPLEPGDDAHDGAPSVWTGAGTQLSLAGAWDLVVQVRSGARTTEVPLVLITRAPPTTSVVAQGSEDLPDIETFTLSTGEQLQMYLDPGDAGTNEFHVTAFDPAGKELPLSGLVVVATGPDGQAETLDVTRLTPGHFAAPVEVEVGTWRFDVVATTVGGTVLQVNREQGI
ncbi:MAG: copper resistance CopC/CopD family protein [Actinomycetota bacterium]